MSKNLSFSMATETERHGDSLKEAGAFEVGVGYGWNGFGQIHAPAPLYTAI